MLVWRVDKLLAKWSLISRDNWCVNTFSDNYLSEFNTISKATSSNGRYPMPSSTTALTAPSTKSFMFQVLPILSGFQQKTGFSKVIFTSSAQIREIASRSGSHSRLYYREHDRDGNQKLKAISDIKEQDLDRVNKNHIRYQTLAWANDVISNHTAKLSIFSEYNLSDYGVHATTDGQKFATKYNTIKSRYSKKYFGMLQGVVLFSQNANHLPLCLKVIGAY